MFENIKMALLMYKTHLQVLRQGLSDAENKYLNDTYTLKDFVEIVEHHIRVGSAPMINQKKLFSKYISDFCKRYKIDNYRMQNQIRNFKSPNLPQFDGNWYFSSTKN